MVFQEQLEKPQNRTTACAVLLATRNGKKQSQKSHAPQRQRGIPAHSTQDWKPLKSFRREGRKACWYIAELAIQAILS